MHLNRTIKYSYKAVILYLVTLIEQSAILIKTVTNNAWSKVTKVNENYRCTLWNIPLLSALVLLFYPIKFQRVLLWYI